MEPDQTNLPRLLRLAREQASSPTPPSSKTRRLKLTPPNRRLLKHIERSLPAVDSGLFSILTKLVDGELPWPLFLWGETGRGKTCAALAVCDVCDSAAFYDLEDFASYIVSHTAEEVRLERDRLAEKELLVVDEIGARVVNGDLHYRAIKLLYDLREQYAGRAMIAISNVKPSDLEALYDSRVSGRLLSGTVYELRGSNRRATK